MDDDLPPPRRGFCCCPCFDWGNSLPRSVSSSSSADGWWERMRNSARGGGGEGRWWSPVVGPLLKVREWSELVAGPRWKTFIRRFNRNPYTHVGNGSGGGGERSGWRRTGTFQYDPLSYALNFDEGHGGSPDDETFARVRSFSMRSTSTRLSVADVGGGEEAASSKNSEGSSTAT